MMKQKNVSFFFFVSALHVMKIPVKENTSFEKIRLDNNSNNV